METGKMHCHGRAFFLFVKDKNKKSAVVVSA
jgi:hypothetical protein